ncbi:MAG: hypothetical protein K6U04_03915 [Armatimonadetes bacterium]|nr:hypothetical protein [Armatimonadota bacterium]
MSAIRNKLIEMLNDLPEEKIAILLDFAQKIKENVENDDEELSLQEKEMIRASEEEYSKGEYVWWRDVKRTIV